MADDYFLRPMRHDDVPAAQRLTADGFHELDLRTSLRDEPAPTPRSAAGAAVWRRRMVHVLDHDAAGCWVAEDQSGLLGMAASLKRDLTWILATYVVRPGHQGRGVGKQLLDASLVHGSGCLRAMLTASQDPKASRRYRLAGFTMHPTMVLSGAVDRHLLPVVDRVREGSASDIDLMNSVDRQVRESAHGVDHEILTSLHRIVVIDRSTGSGYAYVEPDGGPYLLAATNRRTAADLLWEALAASAPDKPCTINYVTPDNEWAVDVAIAARMDLHNKGYLALRGMKPPVPYIPSGHFL